MSEQTGTPDPGGSGLNLRLVLGALAAVALGLFVFQNTEDAPIEFLWMEGSVPLFLLLLITVGLTLVLAIIGQWFMRRRS